SADHLLSHSLLPLSLIMPPLPPSSTLFPYTTLFRSQVLDDRNPGAQESGVCGTSAVRIVIDIEGVDSHERGACRQQMLGRLAGEERVARAVPLGPPVGVPPGVYEHRLAPHVSPAKQGG